MIRCVQTWWLSGVFVQTFVSCLVYKLTFVESSDQNYVKHSSLRVNLIVDILCWLTVLRYQLDSCMKYWGFSPRNSLWGSPKIRPLSDVISTVTPLQQKFTTVNSADHRWLVSKIWVVIKNKKKQQRQSLMVAVLFTYTTGFHSCLLTELSTKYE